jgi:hypothetical protein
MTSRYSAAVRLLGLALLVLAVSPVTAPFSTFDLVGLLTGTPQAASSLQTKKIADEPSAELGGQSPLVGIDLAWSVIRALDDRPGGTRVLLDIPLRI